MACHALEKTDPSSDRRRCEGGGIRGLREGAAWEARLDVKAGIGVTVDKGQVVVTRSSDERKVRAMHGLVRAELNNMVEGVTKGYERNMEITGVGYKAAIQGRTMSFNVGYINPVLYPVPTGIDVKVDKQTLINIKGSDKRLVGQVAANLRAIKPPDVYKQGCPLRRLKC